MLIIRTQGPRDGVSWEASSWNGVCRKEVRMENNTFVIKNQELFLAYKQKK